MSPRGLAATSITGLAIGGGGVLPRYFAGPALNFVAHDAPQK
jgi:hypothetical protein